MISISQKLISQIKLEAEKAYPNECCGFIFGTIENGIKYARHRLAAVNSSDESEKFHRFEITPEQMLNAERCARLMGLDIVGFYHSHPDCSAAPSEYDRSHALPVYSYIIVSAVKGKAADFKSWELDKKTDYQKFIGEDTMLSI